MSAYQTEELFGPDVAVHSFDGEDAAVALANGTAFGLCASVFTNDRARFERLASQLRAGVINWNSPTVGASGKLPFGGVGHSGNHRPAGIFSALYCAWPAALSFGPTGPTPTTPAPGL
jgi:succinylglutamic semialdehyde dehydrogenase